MSDDDFRDVTLAPDARAAFCAYAGVPADQADAMLAQQNAALQADWTAYRAAHPAATLQDFAAADAEQLFYTMGREQGLPGRPPAAWHGSRPSGCCGGDHEPAGRAAPARRPRPQRCGDPYRRARARRADRAGHEPDASGN